MRLPLLAFTYFLRPKLLALGFFPGAFTFSAASLAVYGVWASYLQTHTLWIAVPVMMLVFLSAWLLIGNLSLLFVEDKIIDECQKIYLGEVRLHPPKFQISRVVRELKYSIFVAAISIVLFAISFIPALGIISFVLLAWLTAYGFLSSLYSRKTEHVSKRMKMFFADGASNLALGVFLNFLLFVPVLNVFLLGYAQILATLVFCQRETRACFQSSKRSENALEKRLTRREEAE